VQYNNKEKLKEKYSSCLTEPESSVKITKGKRTGQGGTEGRDKCGEEEWGH